MAVSARFRRPPYSSNPIRSINKVMAVSGPWKNTPLYAGVAAALVTTYFAFSVFAGWTILQYGVRTPDFGWDCRSLGKEIFVASVKPEGPAAGVLQSGDRVVALNGSPVSTEAELSLALRTVAGVSLYTVGIHRQGQPRDVWLRSRTEAGTRFFKERLPLLGSSLLMFCAGLAMLMVRWDSTASRYGSLAAMAGALRLGAWALLPLSAYFGPQEYRPYFVFWLPAVATLPLGYWALLHFEEPAPPARGHRLIGYVLTLAALAIVSTIAWRGEVPVPVPDGLAWVAWDHVYYDQSHSLLELGAAVLMAITAVAVATWMPRLFANRPSPETRNRLLWLVPVVVFFVLPAGAMELLHWWDGGGAEPVDSVYSAMAVVAFSYLVAAGQVSHPVQVLRSMLGAALPERVFARLDRRWFPRQSAVERRLRAVEADLESCRTLERLHAVLTEGVQSALDTGPVVWNADAPIEEMLSLPPKPSGEPVTRREQRLVLRAVQALLRRQDKLETEHLAKEKMEPEPVLDLLRECPRCGRCYGSGAVRCEADGEVPVVTLPVERLIEGKYQLERRIGRGGMGAVYAGRDLRLGRRVAVKVMLSELFGHHEALRRFEREARAAARLSHRNVVQIHDYGPIGAMGAFLVMEYIEGRSWRDDLRMWPAVPPAVCLPWVEQLLDGVAAAHAAGIVHRDLKPENLLLAGTGEPAVVKILDFGLAKMLLLDFSREEKVSLNVSMIGTIGYVPPEQLTGGEVDERSDIYAIGRIVIETISGKLPEAGVGGIEAPLGPVLERCVALRKEDRYGSVVALRGELLPALASFAAAVHT